MIEFQVPAMSCGHCVGAVTQAIKLLDPQARVQVDLASKKVTVESGKAADTVAQALTEAGYPPARQS